jgi:hypothetical protein
MVAVEKVLQAWKGDFGIWIALKVVEVVGDDSADWIS